MSKPDPIEKPMLLEVGKLNGLLSDLDAIREQNDPLFVSEEVDHRYYEVFDMGLGAGAFLKLRISTWRDEEEVDGIEFVPLKQKTITVYDF